MSASDPPTDRPPITRVLQRLAAGEPGAADELLPMVYEELRQLAQARVARLAPGQTLQATALVHEAWVRLGARDAVQWHDRAHFFGAAARAMRFILVEQARRKHSGKRGGGSAREVLHDDIAAPEEADAFDLEALDRALTQLEQEHERCARLVTLRYFGGLAMEEIAELLEVSDRTAQRDWLFARTWLRLALGGDDGDDGE